MKNLNNLLLGLSALFLFSACNNGGQTDVHHITPSDTITTEVNLPTIMKYVDGKLIIVDLFTEKNCVKIIDSKTKEVLCDYLQKGNASNEVLHISSMDVNRVSDGYSIMVYDPVKMSITEWDINDLLQGNTEGISQTISGDDGTRFTEVYRIDHGFLATGLFTNGHKFAILDDSLKLMKYEQAYLENKGTNRDMGKLAIANNGLTVFNPTKEMMTSVVYMASELHFYNIDEGNITEKATYTISPLNYEVEDDHIVNKEMEGYLSATYSNEEVYALYCGVPESDGLATYGQEVHVFDLNGNIKRKLILDTPAFQIAVDEGATTLFALCHEPDPCVKKYAL